MSMFWRKLWADSRALARQTIALNVLIGLGVLLFVGLYEAYQNLTGTYDRIYEMGRLADASVLFDAGPESLADKAATIPQVTAAMGRVVRDGAIIQRGRKRERVMGRFVGVPRGSRPPINDLLLVEGRYVANGREAVLEQQFARDNGYRLGDRVKCLYELSEREFTLVGLAVSPEYIYPVPSKYELWVMPGTFGVVFIDEDQARDWLGLGRGITELHCLTQPGYEAEVLAKLQGIAHAYGVDTAYVQDDQPSKRLLSLDQQGFAQMSIFFPVLFLGAAGLSLYGALSRIVRLQVTVIGTLRASGVARGSIMLQYVLQGGLVAGVGALPGVALGHWLGMGMTGMYADALKLPLRFTPLHWDTLLTGVALALGTGLAAAWLPARSAARLAPAVAMRGDMERPPSRVGDLLVRWTDWLRVMYRIPLRGVFRKASRTVIAMAGIAGGVCIIITTFGMHVSTMDAIDEYLTRSRKYEIDVAFNHPNGFPFAQAASHALGGDAASPTASVPVRITTSWGSGDVTLTGLERGQTMLRQHALDGRPVEVRPGSVWLPKQLARRLRVETGDPVRVEWVRSTRRNRLRTTMQVAGVVDVSMGATAYGELHDVRRSLVDAAYPHGGYGALIACDPSRTEAIRHCLERSDDVAFVSTTADARRQIDQQMGMMFIFIGILLSFGMILAGSVLRGISVVSLLERTRELAALRSLGFTARATAGLAAIELALLATLGLIVGIPLGAKLNELFMASYTTETMSFRSILPWWVYVVTVLIVYALVAYSAYGARQQLSRMDLAQATKARE